MVSRISCFSASIPRVGERDQLLGRQHLEGAAAAAEPAAEQAVGQALERAVGHPLFQPDRRRLELTPMGTALHERAGRMLRLLAETGEEIGAITGVRSGSLRLAGDTTVGVYVLPNALAAFHERHGDIALSLEVVNRAGVRDLLLAGSVDLGVVGRLWEDGRIEGEPFLENELMCFSAPHHPLVKREPLQPHDLLDGPLLLREPGSGTRESAERILRQAGVDPVPVMEMASNGALKNMVAGGLGVTVLSIHAVRLELRLGLLRSLSVEGFPVRRMWHIAWSHERFLTPAAAAFRSFLHESQWRQELSLALVSE
jgi:DNA-binding transcriptional LysR family regulator